MIEPAVKAPHSVYEAVVNDGRKKTAIHDTARGVLDGVLAARIRFVPDVAQRR